MSDPREAAEIPGGVDILEPVALAPTEQFLASIDPLVQDYGIALRTVRSIARGALSDDFILGLLHADYEDMADASRGERRFDQAFIRSQRQDMAHTLMGAKNDAQLLEIGGKADDEEYVAAQIAQHTFDSSETTGSRYLFLRASSQIWLNMFSAERRKVQLEKQLQDQTLGLINTHGVVVLVDLLSTLKDPSRDPDELRPFLQYLAKNHFDPFEKSILEASLERLEGEPQYSLNAFLHLVDDCFSDDEELQKTAIETIPKDAQTWFKFLRDVLKVDDGALPPSTLLGAKSWDHWPPSLQEAFLGHHRRVITETRDAYLEMLTPLRDSSNFYIRDTDLDTMSRPAQTTQRSGGKRRKGGATRGGRVTARRAKPEDFVLGAEIDTDSRPVGRIATLSKTPEGHMLGSGIDMTSEDFDETQLDTQLLALRPVADYLASKRSDSDIQTDLLKMLRSLLEEPRGNGAEKTTDIQISITSAAVNNRRTSVWRLNTNKRTNLSVGDVARQTRIFYTLSRDDEGRTVLGILDISHKASNENLRGGWKHKRRK